jgi:hypothetical protein
MDVDLIIDDENLAVQPLVFAIGASVALQRFIIQDPLPSWSNDEGAPRCAACKHQLHLEWENTHHGLASCHCEPPQTKRFVRLP